VATCVSVHWLSREDGTLDSMLEQRYSSFDSVNLVEMTFKELEEYTLKHGEPKTQSGKQELFEAVFNQYF
jgi:xylose isomerase